MSRMKTWYMVDSNHDVKTTTVLQDQKMSANWHETEGEAIEALRGDLLFFVDEAKTNVTYHTELLEEAVNMLKQFEIKFPEAKNE